MASAADKFKKLSMILRGSKGRSKVPTETPSSRVQRRIFDTFQRSAQSIFLQSLVGNAERQERYRDFEEMDQMPEISKALDIYADDSTVVDHDGDIIDIVSDDEDIVSELEELFYERIDLDFYIWRWIRNLAKYGDNILLLDIVEKDGVLGLIQLPVIEIEREEGFDGDPNSVRFKWMAQGNTVFENYQVSHMRILGDDRYLPYGRSVLEPCRKIWKQLTMAEDAMLIYRFTRAPERRIYYIDVGNIPPKDVDVYMLQARDKLSRTPLITESTGQIDYRFNPQSILEDIFLPMRGERGSRVETLPGGQNTGDIEDIEYLQNKLFIALGVPKSYLSAQDALENKGSLAQEDIKFARTIQRIQKIVVSELAKIGLIHLYLRGFDEEKIYNFDLQLTNPSTVMEMMQLDLVDKKYDVAAKIKDLKLVDDYYIQKEILQLSDSEIAEINFRIIEDAKKASLLANIEANGEAGGAASGFGGGEEEAAPEEDDEQENGQFTEKQSNPMKPANPAGARDIPGATGYGETEEPSIDPDDSFDDPSYSATGAEIIPIPKKKRNRFKRKDPLDRTISDIMRVNTAVNRLVEQLQIDTAADKIVRVRDVFKK